MPLEAIKNWQYLRALQKLPGISPPTSSGTTHINPARQYLLFFNGTDEKDVQFFQSLHQIYEKQGIRIKILAFVKTKEEVQHFGMALYNEKSVQWSQVPKPKLIELVQSRQFDILFNINPEGLKHLHYLAVAAKADFKISTLTELPNDFKLTITTKAELSQKQIYEEMWKSLEILSV